MDKLRVYWVEATSVHSIVPEPEYTDVKSVESAISALEKIINDNDEKGTGGLEMMDTNGDWIEYVDDVGRDIWEIKEAKDNGGE